MLLNGAVVFISLAFIGTAQARGVECPAFLGKSPFSNVALFDGPPEELADLVPDNSSGSGDYVNFSWEVGYIYDNGRMVYLVCKYKGISETVTVKSTNKVINCIYKSHFGAKSAEMYCE